MTSNSDLRREARERLRGTWGPAAGASAIYLLIIGALGASHIAGVVLSALVAGPLSLGFWAYFLDISRGQHPQITSIFRGFDQFLKAFVTYLLMMVFVFLWSLLFIVPGIVAALSYSMTWFILADEPQTDAYEAIQKSRALMRGRRWKLFWLLLSFTGWAILSCLSFGLGFLLLFPYTHTALARFYGELKPEAAWSKETGLPPPNPQQP